MIWLWGSDAICWRDEKFLFLIIIEISYQMSGQSIHSQYTDMACVKTIDGSVILNILFLTLVYSFLVWEM